MEPTQVRAGDLLLVTRIPGEPLGALMQRLDGTVFSHSGIAVRAWGQDEGSATHMASALATTLPSSVDIGGVRCDEFRRFWDAGRDLYCIEQPDELRDRALRYLVRFRPEPRREGTFSVVKLVTVAAALRSVELHATDPRLAERLFRAAAEVATAWAASDGAESFYCAELVATAYGRRFRREELAPPPIRDVLGDEIDEPRWLAWLMRMFSERVDGIDDARGRTWAMLFGLLSGDDLDFLQHAAVAVAASGGVALGHALEAVLEKLPGSRLDSTDDSPFVPVPLTHARAMPDLPNPDAPLPHALVTPRMLWAAFGRHELRRVEGPG